MELQTLIREMTSVVSISGFEYLAEKKIRELLESSFNEYSHSPAGSYTFIKRCKKSKESVDSKVPALMIDAHFDEIGFMVTGILDGGFVKVLNLGGIDTKIMSASEVLIYGSLPECKTPVKAVVASTPPHLQNGGDQNKLPAVTELLLDTGYKKETLEKMVAIGDPVGFLPEFYELMNGRFVGKGFDNKATAAIAAYAVATVNEDELDCDVILVLSSKEETTMAGARTEAFKHSANIEAALVVDVNYGQQPDVPGDKSGKLGEGPMISFAVVTDRSLTQAVKDCTEANEINCKCIWEPTNTGTNANVIALTAEGIPTAVCSLPIKNMHTYSEELDISDAEKMAVLIQKFVSGGFTKWINN